MLVEVYSCMYGQACFISPLACFCRLLGSSFLSESAHVLSGMQGSHCGHLADCLNWVRRLTPWHTRLRKQLEFCRDWKIWKRILSLFVLKPSLCYSLGIIWGRLMILHEAVFPQQPLLELGHVYFFCSISSLQLEISIAFHSLERTLSSSTQTSSFLRNALSSLGCI